MVEFRAAETAVPAWAWETASQNAFRRREEVAGDRSEEDQVMTAVNWVH